MTAAEARDYLRTVKETAAGQLILNWLRGEHWLWAAPEDLSDNVAVTLAEEVQERLADASPRR